MARRIGGEDPLELREAFTALGEVSGFKELEAFVRDWRIVRSPAFAALLRQEYLRIRSDRPDNFAAFRGMYSDLFWLLHREAYTEQCTLALQKPPPPIQSSPDCCFPEFHQRVLEILNGRIPPIYGSPTDPSNDGAGVRSELESLLSMPVELPEYVRSLGMSWSLLGVRCPRCEHEYPTVRPHAIDLLAAPELRALALAGRFETPGCPECGEICAIPLGVFLEDSPFAGDPLASLSCIWRIAPDFIVYRPPPGTERREQWDRVLEIRCSLRVGDLGWDKFEDDSASGPQSVSYSVAYTARQLHELIESGAEGDDIPRAMSVTIDDIAGKLRSGMLPFHQAEEQIATLAEAMAGQWPLVAVPPPSAVGGRALEGLVQALIAETIAATEAKPEMARVFLATSTMTYYIELNESAAAERALARAEDLLAKVPAEDPRRIQVETSVRGHRADLLDAIGRHAEADEIRRSLDTGEFVDEHSYSGRVIASQQRERIALSHFEQGRLANALSEYPECIAQLRALLDEAETGGTPEAARFVDSVRHNLSGALANFGAVLQSCAEYVAAATRVHAGASNEEIWQNYGFDAASALQMVRELRPALRRSFPDGFATERLRQEASVLLREALEHAQVMGAWGFAGIQVHRLAALAKEAGNDSEAARLAAQAIQYAERSGDHARAWTARAFLASLKLEEGDGEAALEHLEGSVLEWMRERIGRGHHLQADPAAMSLGHGIASTVESGADSTRAVIALENLKAATTAAALATGFPIRPSGDRASDLARQVDEAAAAREKVRLDLIWSQDDEELLEALSQANARLSQLRASLSLRDPRFSEWVDATDVQLSGAEAFHKRLARLGAGTRFLGAFAEPESLWTYMIGPNETLLSRHPLPDPEDLQVLNEAGLERLAASFIEPFKEELKLMEPGERLLVSPDFSLFGIPFAALPLDGAPVCTKVTMSFVQGAGVFEAIQGRSRERYSRVSALGGPKRPNWSDLPGAQEEVKRVLQHFPDPPDPVIGRKATVPALVASLDDIDVLHLACHATIPGPVETTSGLVLSPDLRNGDSGILSEDRIVAELELSPGCFVNLAGCSTAAQRRDSGPLLGGLVPAFFVAGAGSVLASVAPLADGEATVFQEHFYDRLLAGLSPATSLAECQRACLRGEFGDEMRAPHAWAWYVLYGASK
jgi:hypothetical protein